jgi:hypothetical protein|tara:strand:+ start:51 stop:752 length:702 start_codon:yes stop_codon:yes gene_type:complete
MKYTNILGKDFKHKKDAKEYFNSILYSIKRPGRDNHITFTEETLIKQSHVKSLYNNYLTNDEKTLYEVFRGDKPQDWGCKFLSNEIINLTFELEARNQDRIPISPSRIFTCFGAATTNYTLNEKKTARFLVQNQRDDFLRKFLKTDEYLGSDSVFECDKCKCHKKIEVHHVTPFNDIFDEWRENVWKEDLFPDSACSSFGAEADGSWCQFHYNVVIYQKLCKSCHTKETYGRD